MVIALYYLDGKGGFAQGDSCAGGKLYGATVAAEHKLAGATRYLQRNGYIVIYYQGAYRETVGRNGSQHPVGSLWHEDGASGAE